MSKKAKVTKQIETNFVDYETGEIKSTEMMKEWSIPREEPDYVKFYLNAVLEFNEISSANTGLLVELMRYMSYADDEDGGQMIYLNKLLKTRICDKLGIKEITYRKNIKKLCDGKILKKIGTNTYQANPYIFGKGDWASIKNLRASFDWEHGFVVKDTTHEE